MDSREVGIAINGSASAAATVVGALVQVGTITTPEGVVETLQTLTDEFLQQRIALMQKHGVGASKPSSSSSSGGGKSWGKSGGGGGKPSTSTAEASFAQLKFLKTLVSQDVPADKQPADIRERFLNPDGSYNEKGVEGLQMGEASTIISKLVEIKNG